jgi:hypothetical protein
VTEDGAGSHVGMDTPWNGEWLRMDERPWSFLIWRRTDGAMGAASETKANKTYRRLVYEMRVVS